MSAALEFTPAPCCPVPEAFVQQPRLRLLADPGLDPALDPEFARWPERPADVRPLSVLHAPRQSERAAPVRLTRRGVVVLAALVTAVAGAVLWVAALSAPSSPSAESTAHRGTTVTVRAGDTLWSIAGRLAPNGDPRAEVAALQRSNHLAGERLTPGETLRVP